ncbi:hypothetical protein QFC24_001024 [Naganishia onofrii]|uniref:Uncharacterized protein n=1 Tax=Naganishia onofrii TaxID=1851511 RepID=A0ACC2XUA9_9TREE|nr:hypothetical protein QFC24_001024 [Naganishia onofrii]
MSDSTNPPLPAEPAPETTLNDNTTNDQPPLPDEPAPTPTPTSHVSSKPSTTVVEEAEDEDAPFAGASNGKGKGKGKQHAALTDGDDAQEAEEDGDEAEEEEWDPSAVESRSLKDRKAAEEKPTTSNQQITGKQGDGQPVSADTGGWQAIWAPAQNAYYFWNANTGAVQWENPLVPAATANQESTSTGTNTGPDVQPPLPDEPPLPTAGGMWGQPYATSSVPGVTGAGTATTLPTHNDLPPIDPALAHLLPASQRGTTSSSSSSTSDAHLYQTAQFNARTGRFTAHDYAYTVDHLAEANRAKRQEMAYFDVAEWEREREEEHVRKRQAEEEGGERPKKLTKKDMVGVLRSFF